MNKFLAAFAIVIGMGSSAHAATVGSAPAYGGTTQSIVVCYYSNLGATSINVTSSQILVEPGTAVSEATESCSGPIAAGSRCRTVSVTVVNNGAHWCRAVVDSKAALRGRMEIRDSSGNVLSSEEIK